jgi:hypothetical protein
MRRAGGGLQKQFSSREEHRAIRQMEKRLHSQVTESAGDIERLALDAADAIRRLVGSSL